ncbi:MAG: DPP IV N-terminal domain-containing protein, partial [Acidobacteriota bacterium]
AALAAALSAAAGESYQPFGLPFTTIELSADGRSVSFEAVKRRWTCDVAGQKCAETKKPEDRAPADSVTSPDGRQAAFVRNFNLWVRDLATGREKALTTGGTKDYGYATNNAGWTKSDRPVLLWSPDSTKIATFQHDSRGTGEMYMVSTAVGHPELEAWKYPLPGDDKIFMIERLVVKVESGRAVRFDMPPDPHRSSICDHVYCGGRWVDVEWSPDGSKLCFLSNSRDHKHVVLREGDVATGTVRTIMEERVPTFFESGDGAVNWHALPASNELVWFSQRDDWGHLYLYDLTTGRLKHQITKGPWNVLQIRRIDEGSRTIYFTGAGREPGDPYFEYFYSVGFDGSDLKLLTPKKGNHTITLSPSEKVFVDSCSTPVVPPVTVVRDLSGKVLVQVEQADISKLLATGWEPPNEITVKARDGKTDLYGLMYVPANLDRTKKYPVINRVYPGPQTGSVGSRSFSAARGDIQAMAELGFVMVQIDAMGTPMRSKSFHAYYYGNMGDNGLPDQIAGMKELAARYSWIDIDRAGITGHSGGGFASTDGILRYPDFFKVAVSQAGNHDNRVYEDDWGEKWQGLLEKAPDGSTNYDDQANQNLAKNSKGKLLIAHGTMDGNVPPNSTLLLVNELIANNKDFDLIMFPNRRHGFGNEPYMMRRRWDYFVKHLLGAEPPKEYKLQTETEQRRPGGE